MAELSAKRLAEIRDRDESLYSSRSARDLAQADRHLLLAEVDRLTEENAYLKADTPPYIWMYSDDHYGSSEPEPFASREAAHAKAEADYLAANFIDPATALAEGDAALEWSPILDCDADQLLDKGARTGLIVARIQVQGRLDPAESAKAVSA